MNRPAFAIRPYPRRLVRLLAIAALIAMAGCTAPSAPQPTPVAEVAPRNAAEQPYPITYPTSAQETSLAPYPAPAQPTATPLPQIEEPTIAPALESPTRPTTTPAALPLVEGEIVLKLSPGSGPGQVGIRGDSLNSSGPMAFRIGGDGTIRVLDNYNRRVLFFDQKGKLLRSLSIDEARNPVDFIVNPQGSVFVLDRGDGRTTQVLRYAPDGRLAERLPLDTNVGGAEAITLTADQDLLIVSGNQAYWSLIHKGVTVAPELQPLTRREGTATPRSPMIFRTIADAGGTRTVYIAQTTSIDAISSLSVNLPAEVGLFFNVDRAMNLYFVGDWGYPGMAVVRVLPDGTVAGGAQIQLEGCHLSWRQFYIDQAGSVWTMCVNDQGATVKRYTLVGPDGQPLPEASKQPADVIWRPGAQVNLSSG
jgi:hypothetical protein